MAPFCPFLTENMFQTLKKFMIFSADVVDSRSIHFLLYPVIKEEFMNTVIETTVSRMQSVIELTRKLRETKGISLKTPLKELSVLVPSQQYQDDLESMKVYLLEELNVRNLVITHDEIKFGVLYKAIPNFKALGQRLKGDLIKVQRAIVKLTGAALKQFLLTESIIIEGIALGPNDLDVLRYQDDTTCIDCVSTGTTDLLISLNTKVDDSLREEGLAREVVNRIQRLRKKLNLKSGDQIDVFYNVLKDVEEELVPVFENHLDYIKKSTKSEVFPLLQLTNGVKDAVIVGREEFEINSALLELTLRICD